jgi:hypothetical protein
MTSGTTPQSSYLFSLFPPNLIADRALNMEIVDYGIIPFMAIVKIVQRQFVIGYPNQWETGRTGMTRTPIRNSWQLSLSNTCQNATI